MYIVDKKVYLHIVKCGGSSFRELLFRHRQSDIKFSSEHFPMHRISDKFKDYETYTVLREPVSWYKSFYAYTLQLHNPRAERGFNALAEMLVYENGRPINFDDFVKKATDLEKYFKENPVKLDLLIKKTKARSKMKLNYFSAFFIDLTDKEEISKMLSKSLYRFFIDAVSGLEADNIYVLGENTDKLYEVFGLDATLTPYRRNEGKSKHKIGQVSDESIKLIYEAERDLYDRFNFGVEI